MKSSATKKHREFVTCPKCGKRAYWSKRAAKAARVHIGDHSLHWYYQHGYWHLGHMLPGTTRAWYRGETEPVGLLEEIQP